MLTKSYVTVVAFLESLKRDQRGVTAIEYALVGVGIAGIVAAVFTVGENNALQAALESALDKIAASVDSAGTAPAPNP